jgi:RNA polymerase sigma-70 factor (ECF subfamily)
MRGRHDNASITSPAMPEAATPADAFDAFVREQRHGLLQFLRSRTASEQDAEDALQESLARLLRYRNEESSEAWRALLYRIATNVAHDQYRAGVCRHNSDHVPLDDLPIADNQHTPEQRAAYDQQVTRIGEAILALPPKCQRAYLLKRAHGLSHAQIAARCGISVKMVEKHLAKAMALLRRKVGDSFTDTFR